MAGLYTITTRADGLILEADIYNQDHQNHVNNHIPEQMDDYSVNAVEMGTQTDPGSQGDESLPTSLAGELERLRYAINQQKATEKWYDDPYDGGGMIGTVLSASVYT